MAHRKSFMDSRKRHDFNKFDVPTVCLGDIMSSSSLGSLFSRDEYVSSTRLQRIRYYYRLLFGGLNVPEHETDVAEAFGVDKLYALE